MPEGTNEGPRMEPIPKVSWRDRLVVVAVVGSLLAYIVVVRLLLPTNAEAIVTTSVALAVAAMPLVAMWMAVRHELKTETRLRREFHLFVAWCISEVAFFVFISWYVGAIAFHAFGPGQDPPLWAGVTAVGLCIVMAGLGIGYQWRKAQRA